MLEIIRQTHVIDATGIAPGRVATQVAKILMGKNKPTYSPHIDAGDFVVVENASKVKFTGRKLAQKDYYHHTMHPGGIKRTPMKKVFDNNPADVIKKTVQKMLPKNSLRVEMLKRLDVKV